MEPDYSKIKTHNQVLAQHWDVGKTPALWSVCMFFLPMDLPTISTSACLAMSALHVCCCIGSQLRLGESETLGGKRA